MVETAVTIFRKDFKSYVVEQMRELRRLQAINKDLDAFESKYRWLFRMVKVFAKDSTVYTLETLTNENFQQIEIAGTDTGSYRFYIKGKLMVFLLYTYIIEGNLTVNIIAGMFKYFPDLHVKDIIMILINERQERNNDLSDEVSLWLKLQ